MKIVKDDNSQFREDMVTENRNESEADHSSNHDNNDLEISTARDGDNEFDGNAPFRRECVRNNAGKGVENNNIIRGIHDKEELRPRSSTIDDGIICYILM